MEQRVIKNISIIVAVAENYAIGKNNRLLWHLSDDLKRFKRLTTGHTVIMGRNTFLSLPKGALPNRRNIVITDQAGERFKGCEMAYSIEDVLRITELDNECFIIGGGMIYSQFIPLASRLYLTKVNHSFDADTFFPEIDLSQWEAKVTESFQADEKNEFTHTFTMYERKNV